MTTIRKTRGPAESRPGLGPSTLAGQKAKGLEGRLERNARTAFVLPAVLVVLFLSIFPLILSLYFSLVRLSFAAGGVQLTFVGLDNYAKLLVGLNRPDLLGAPTPNLLGAGLLCLIALAATIWLLTRYARSKRFSFPGLIGRLVVSVFALALIWLSILTLYPDGRPGSLVVTLFYVFAGIAVQFVLGLGLALLCAQRLPGRSFFRVVFLIPMMITPVGVAYLFRMLTDTVKGPFLPFWTAIGLANYSWVTDAWGARLAVLIGDTWQWTPFMFIVLLAALESEPVEHIEAALVDGANKWDIFWNLTVPDILPVSTTIILIRMIEAFKIVDLPNVLTNGGPGTATESLTLHSYILWRNLDIGGSAAVAYILLFVVTFVGIAYVNMLRTRAAEGV
jgi:multiple sugar transport system permease protein